MGPEPLREFRAEGGGGANSPVEDAPLRCRCRMPPDELGTGASAALFGGHCGDRGGPWVAPSPCSFLCDKICCPHSGQALSLDDDGAGWLTGAQLLQHIMCPHRTGGLSIQSKHTPGDACKQMRDQEA